MHEVVKEAIERAKRGEGPTFIEARTFRHRGHFEGDTYDYVDQDVLKDWKENRDPIKNFKKQLIENEICTSNDLINIDEQVEQEILEAIKIAENAPLPSPEIIYEGLFA
jgi:TPP-dependent pyruvate/acetoin dehydrogenase alpha subunit